MIDKWLTTAWDAYKRNWLGIVAVILAVYIVTFVITGIVAAITGVATVGATILSYIQDGLDLSQMGPGLAITLFIAWLVSIWSQTAVLSAYRDALAGTVDVGKAINDGIKYYGKMLGVSLITSLAVGIPIILGVLALPIRFVGAVLAAILWIAAFLVSLLLLWAPAYVVTEGLDVVDALKKSWEHTKNKPSVVLWLLATAIVLSIIALVLSKVIPVLGFLLTLLVIEPLVGIVYLQAAKE